jgi:hypothetical protein
MFWGHLSQMLLYRASEATTFVNTCRLVVTKGRKFLWLRTTKETGLDRKTISGNSQWREGESLNASEGGDWAARRIGRRPLPALSMGEGMRDCCSLIFVSFDIAELGFSRTEKISRASDAISIAWHRSRPPKTLDRMCSVPDAFPRDIHP